jgi:hypothetical protein
MAIHARWKMKEYMCAVCETRYDRWPEVEFCCLKVAERSKVKRAVDDIRVGGRFVPAGWAIPDLCEVEAWSRYETV